jgi:hypothetical protein
VSLTSHEEVFFALKIVPFVILILSISYDYFFLASFQFEPRFDIVLIAFQILHFDEQTKDNFEEKQV